LLIISKHLENETFSLEGGFRDVPKDKFQKEEQTVNYSSKQNTTKLENLLILSLQPFFFLKEE